MLCTKCKKNVAIVFITKYTDGVPSQEGYCLKCAKDLGLQPLNTLLDESGMNDMDFDQINEHVNEMIEGVRNGEIDLNQMISDSNINPEMLNNMPLFNGMFPGMQASNLPEETDDDEIVINEGETINIDLNEPKKNKKRKKRKFLDVYGTNLTLKASEGKIDRVIGRDSEIERVIQILNRRQKNNPCLIGEPGVGKTAIAEGLAVRIHNKEVPYKLRNAEIYLLDLTSIVAGTQFRGQFESRLKGIVEEAKSLGNIILVIDELHNIVGAGEAEGAMNAANILKPALARGDIQIIGATTLNEYRKHIEKDTALERRFQPIIVDEPSISDSIEILKGIKLYYENFHRVKISDDIIKLAVEMSERYITDRYLPDKAIDVIDEAGARSNLNNQTLVELAASQQKLNEIEEKLEHENSQAEINYQLIAELKVEKYNLVEKIRQLQDSNNDPEITAEDVASVIEAWTKIPVKRITEDEAEKLLNLEDRMKKHVIGQDDAVKSVAKTICRNRSGFAKRKKPASFMFIGSTGVGKTELVRTLARELFDNEEAMIRLDMSEYMEKHTVSKMIGSPPGYVGYDDAGQLTEKVRRKPYSVILLDEIEKAHSDVYNMLLQIFEDGRLTDSHGRVVNFENTVIIMTSNVGANLKTNTLGFSSDSAKDVKAKRMDQLKQTFKPEFLNRIDEIVEFNSLTKENLCEIVKLMIEEVAEEARIKNIELEVDDAVCAYLVEKSYDEKYGARPLRREIQNSIEDELSMMFLKRAIKDGDKVCVSLDNDKLKFDIK